MNDILFELLKLIVMIAVLWLCFSELFYPLYLRANGMIIQAH